MIIAWKGKGILVPVIFLGNIFASVVVKLPHDQSNAFFASTTLLSLWIPGMYFNRRGEGFSFTEVYWGFSSPHTFFHIPFQYWGLFAPLALLVDKFK